MKKLVLPLVAVFALLACSASAELIFYKGTGKVTYIGNGQTLKVSFRSHVVVNHGSNQVATILYANIFGTKVYLAGTESGLNQSTVTGANGKTYTAITQPLDDDDEDNSVELILAQGADAPLPLSTNLTVQFPKKLSTVQQVLVKSEPQDSLVLGNLNSTFDKKATQASNHTGESFDAAVDRLIAELEALGYTEAGSLPGGSAGIQSSGGIFTMSFGPSGAIGD